MLGTRTEAVKLAPVLGRFREVPSEFNKSGGDWPALCLLDQVVEALAIVPDYDRDSMGPRQSLAELTLRILVALASLMLKEHPDLVMVQGDTTTTFCGALSGLYCGIPVGHVEAGLRTAR